MMNTGPDEADDAKPPPTAEKKQHKKRHWLRWTIFGISVVVVVLAVVLSVAPKYVARDLMKTELAKIGIETTGSESLYVNLWRGEVRMGPVEFWSEGAERGQVGMVGARLSLATLFKKRALIETFFIEEVDLIVDKRDEGIFINGVSIEQFMTAEEKTGEEVEEEVEEKKKSGWGAGIDKFEFRNSKMILRNFVEGDELEIEIERLFVTLFHTWDPEDPGVVTLRGKIAGGPLTVDAVARPFADDIQFRFKAALSDVPMEEVMNYGRIALLIDRTMFARREGLGSTTLAFSGVLRDDGSVNMNGEQTVIIDDLHFVTRKGVSLQVKKAKIDLLSSEAYTLDGRVEIAGNWDSVVSGLKLETPDGQSAELATVSTEMDSFFFELNADKSISAYLPHESRVEGLVVQADAETALKLAAGVFGLEKLTVNRTPEGATSVKGGIHLKLDKLGARSGPETSVDVATVAADVSELSVVQDTGGSVNLTANLQAKLGQTNAQQGAEMGFGVGAATIDLSKLSLARDAEGRLKISTAPKIEISAPRMTGATPVTVGRISVALTSLVAEMAGGNIAVQTSGSTTVADVKLNVPGAEGQPGTDASIETVRVDLQNVSAKMSGGDIKVNGAIASEISGLAASVPQPGGAMTVSVDQVQTSFPTLDAQVSGGATSVNLAGTTNLAGLRTSMPAAEGRPEMTVGLGSLEVALREIAASVAGEAPQWKVAADVAVKEVVAELKTADSASKITVGSVNVTGVQTDQGFSIGVDEIVVGGIDADLVDKDLKAFGGGGEQKGALKASAPKGAAPTVRLGRLAVGRESTIKFTDTSVDPPVIVVIDLDDVEIKNIDTGDPAKRTDIKVKATINESSKLGVTGWATPLKPTPDFKINLNLKNLPLPAYSSYVSNAIGWHLDGGDLSTTVNATANRNALKGQVGVVVDNLFLNPVTAADGEKLEKQIGVPIQFAVGILKDDQGRIDLDLPLSGTLDKPEVDYSSVIRKAVSGFLGSIFGSDSFQGADGFKFQSVGFAPGAAVLDEAGKQIADQYVTMLEKKSTLKLGVCGRATVQDFVALFGSRAMSPAQAAQTSATAAQPGQPPATAPRPVAPKSISSAQAKALVELAMERTNVVREYLVDEKGINTERIVQCRVTYDLKDTKPPRAQFAM